MGAEESRKKKKKKKKTTYKANDGNLSLAVLGEIISFVTLFFSFFFLFPFVSLVFFNLSWTSTFGVSNVPHNLNLRFSLRVLPVYFASCDFFNIHFFLLLLLLPFRSCLFLSIRCNILVAFYPFLCAGHIRV